MAFSGASASHSQTVKPSSQCEVAVTCQSLAKCRYHYVVGGQYSTIIYATGMGVHNILQWSK